MSGKESKKLICIFLTVLTIFLSGAGIIVYTVDPFFHYHEPWFGLDAVFSAKEHQTPGALKNLKYDSVLLGSSVVMSINTDVLEYLYSSRTIKGVANSASATLLDCYLEMALETHELEYVFYGLDVFSLFYYPEENPVHSDVVYLTNENPFDDVEYLWNGEVIGHRIIDTIRVSNDVNYTWGNAYNFNANVTYGPDAVLAGFNPIGYEIQEPYEYDHFDAVVLQNLQILESKIQENPETEFVFFIPPYSILWWEKAYYDGKLAVYEHALKLSIEHLLQYENVKIYSTRFNDASVITDMYLFMDYIHAGSHVTDTIVWDIGNPEYEITMDNYEYEVERLLEIHEVFHEKLMAEGTSFLYEPGGLQIEQE